MRIKNLVQKEKIEHFAKSFFWFLVGFCLAASILSGSVLYYFQNKYKDRVIPGIFVDNFYIGERTNSEIQRIFDEKNKKLAENSLTFSLNQFDATISAKTLNIGYDTKLIQAQAMSLGKTKNILSDIYIILSSYLNGTFLHSTYTYNSDALKKELDGIQKEVYVEPVDALFTVSNNRVMAFKQSSDGKTIDFESLDNKMQNVNREIIRSKEPKNITINIPLKILKPSVTTEKANNFGIVEIIGQGTSTFYHSIPNRIHNVSLASSRINGVLVAPGEEFSFAKALGDVSKFTGYKEAYVIQNGRTVLGDGGGVCQVSTTLFRALLNAGLPITERHAHAYRVGYYEQDAPPGFDATVFVPSIDLRFKNDTGNHILIQAFVDPTNLSLTFTLYGKKDGREVLVSKPVLSNFASAPADVYQDDPTLPKGEVKQVDFAAPGGKSVFTRNVTRNGKTLISETITSNYTPWAAVYLRGIKE